MTGVAAVHARIAEIQQHVQSLASVAQPRSAQGAGFGPALASALTQGSLADAVSAVAEGADESSPLSALAGALRPESLRGNAPASPAAVPSPTAAPVDGTGGLPGISAAVARWSDLFARETAEHGLPPGLLAAVAQVESGGRPDAVSHAGAIGLMQIMPGTARGLGVDPRDPTQAVDGAARLLAEHLDRFGSLELALAAYNAGPGAVRKHDGVPPYRETQNYVRKVTALLAGGTP
ncbi:lytic transglycosylase domain-containing protein [Thalassiella azotivora]